MLLGYASLIKLTALAIVPGVVLLAYVVNCDGLLRRLLLFGAVAVLVQLPWELWQWQVTGSPFPTWAGKPSAELLVLNEYVRAVTTERSAWIYFTVLPRVAWTFVPALLLLACSWRNTVVRWKGLALLFWSLLILGAHVWLGLQGYSKLLRYAVLVTPATVLLFSLVAAERWEAMREDGPRRSTRGRDARGAGRIRDGDPTGAVDPAANRRRSDRVHSLGLFSKKHGSD